jgi:hypothetical protein
MKLQGFLNCGDAPPVDHGTITDKTINQILEILANRSFYPMVVKNSAFNNEPLTLQREIALIRRLQNAPKHPI